MSWKVYRLVCVASIFPFTHDVLTNTKRGLSSDPHRFYERKNAMGAAGSVYKLEGNRLFLAKTLFLRPIQTKHIDSGQFD